MREAPVLSSLICLFLVFSSAVFAQTGAAASPAPVVSASPEAATDEYRPAQLLTGKRPQYPVKAARKRVEGTVVVRFEVDDTGKVKKARISRGIDELNEAALEAVRAWKFKPAIKAGRAVQVTLEAPVTFELPQ